MMEVSKLMNAGKAFISLSTLANIILAVLIVFRLVYRRRYVRNALGVQHGSPYTNIITMCVESSALMIIVGSLYIILYLVQNYSGTEKYSGTVLMFDVVLDIIPHIFVGGLKLNDF
jgi:hypothetical protein